MEYQVSLTESAKRDIAHFPVREQHEQRIVTAGIIAHLKSDAEVETRKRKQLRKNPIAPWELRIDEFRVFYSIEPENHAKVIVVGRKDHNDLFIRGVKVEL